MEEGEIIAKRQDKANHKATLNFSVVEQTFADIEAKQEEIYQEFKQIWIDNPQISKVNAFKQMDRHYQPGGYLAKYVNERLAEDNLPTRHVYKKLPKVQSNNKVSVDKESNYEEIFQEYKHLFLTTDLPVGEIREKIGASCYNDDKGKYLMKRCKEEGLTVKSRRKQLKNKNKVPAKKSKSKKKKQTPKPKNNKKGNKVGVHNSPGFSDHVKKCVEKSNEVFNKFFMDRNVKRATQKGYEATFHRWFDYHGDKYDTIQDCLDLYMGEEDKRIPMRDRSIKKELLGFRESLLEDPGIKSDKSVKSYFSKMGSFFRHFGLEMPTLPQVKLEKGYVSSYNDLPTHAMIKTACEQSPLDLKALILFMSSSGSAKAETLSITVGMFLKGCDDYLEEPASPENIPETLKALDNRHDIVPLIYLRRIKTDKWYHTCCSPEASYMIIESLKIRDDFDWDDKLFDYTSSLILTKFQEINDNNNWGYVGAYRRFRSHTLRKFMASNIGLPRDQVDSFQGRAKDMIQEAYFKQDPQSLKKIYLNAMNRVMVYDNWGHGTTPEELEKKAKRLFNNFNDDEKIIDLSSIPSTPEEIKTSIGLGEDDKATTVSKKNLTRNTNSANSMPVTPPVQVPVGTIPGGISISEELLNYAKLMDMGLLSIAELNRIKQKLLGGMLY